MSRKPILLGLCSATLFAVAFTSRDAQAGARQRGYSATVAIGTSQPIRTIPARGRYAQPGSPYATYTPGYDKHARQKYPWLFQNLPGHVGAGASGRPRIVEPGQHSSHFPPSRYRGGTKVGGRDKFDIFGSSTLGTDRENMNPGALAAPIGGSVQSHAPIPQPVPPIGGATSGGSDGFGSLRGAGAPSNVNSPVEGIPDFRDEGSAQSSKLPPIPGKANHN